MNLIIKMLNAQTPNNMNALEMAQKELYNLSLNNDSISLVLHRTTMLNTKTFPWNKGGQKFFKGKSLIEMET